MRALPAKSDDAKKENLEKGIEMAKNAVNIDITDAHSWYLLGNAYMTSFFSTEKYEYLDNSLKAYTQSEKTQKYENPDLYFNRATIFTYFERYSEAIRDYMHANTIDPGLDAQTKAQKICEFVIGTTRMIEQKKKTQNKKTADLVKEIPKKIGEVKFLSLKETEETLKYTVKPQSELESGENIGAIFSAKVICHIHKEPEVPACFLVIDSKGTYSVVSLYNINKGIKDKIKYGDEILIRDPVLLFISIEYESRLMTYPCVRVINLSDVLVNEKTLADVYSKAEAVSGTGA
jgi:tetratricopeptide (TPR) repeat protein